MMLYVMLKGTTRATESVPSNVDVRNIPLKITACETDTGH